MNQPPKKTNHLLLRTILWFLLAATQAVPVFAGPVLKGHVLEEVFTLPRLGAVEDLASLRLGLGLPLSDEQGLEDLLSRLYDPRDPLYRRFLSMEAFTQRFGPSESDYQALIAFVESQGLTVTGTFSHRQVLDVSGKASDIQRIFHVNLSYYQRKDGTRFYANDTEPSPESPVSISHISGLNNFHRPFSKLRKIPGGQPRVNGPKVGTGPGGLYRGNDFRDAYAPDVPTTVNGAGQSVALLEYDGFFQSDISNYESGSVPPISAPAPVAVLLDGATSSNPSSAGVTNGNDDEVSLDIEAVAAMAPGAQVVVYMVPGSIYNNGTQTAYDTAADDMLSQMAQDQTCYQISSSWGGYGITTTTNILNQLAAQGQAYFEASGDGGAFNSANPISLDPSLYKSKYETLVGGTGLTTTTPSGSPVSLSYISETTWTDSLGAGSGGIATNFLAIPSYQSSVPMNSNGGSTSWRDLPDVSMCAQNGYLYSENGGYRDLIEGTSMASPLWAAYWALANQEAMAQQKGPLGSANPPLYQVATGANYNTDFHDIADGSDNNWNPNPPNNPIGPVSGPFTAVSGFDLATGWGSPKGQSLISDLVGGLSTWTPTQTPTATSTATSTETPCGYPGNTCTFTPTVTSTFTPTATLTPTQTLTPTRTLSPTPTSTQLLSNLGSAVLAPMPVSTGGSVCLFPDRPISGSQWDVYNLLGESAASLTFANPQGNCWNTQGTSPGVYLVRLKLSYSDGTSATLWKKIVVSR